ncbi:MAG TPA: sulfatase-like hydrolase/transferase [Thermoanaerobaculia bacterium]|nr:sulfatase-like hydrolase/transferase [Thermoanaerobaculia bacterium]
MQLPQRPNIVILISDETRRPMHWPADWVRNNLPAMQRLMNNGLTFTRAYTAACECSPSRASFLTSTYPEQNGVDVTFTTPLPTTLANLATILATANYPVIWKGKWHLSHPVSGSNWTEADIAALQTNYGMQQWNPPDAGTSLGVDSTLGGGIPNNDGRFVMGVTMPVTNPQTQTLGVGGTSALDFINGYESSSGPFCLVVSLVNPHDVFVYPNLTKAGYALSAFQNIPIGLPPNFADDLTTKPSVQLAFRNKFDQSSPLSSETDLYNYVRFYAYLHTLSDQLFNLILDALAGRGLTNSTLVIRMADHGEMGLSHGLREKMYTAYDEAINVPFIVSNPLVWPEGQQTDALISLLDLVPTLAELTGAQTSGLHGKSFAPILDGRAKSVHESVVYTYDDQFNLPQTMATHIRTLRTDAYKYSVYFTESTPAGNFEYELYDMANDPGELTNLVYGNVSPAIGEVWKTLHCELTEKLKKDGAMPSNVDWPVQPPVPTAT